MAAISSLLDGSPTDDRSAIWVEIPTGYVPLPTDDIHHHMAVARDVVTDCATEAQRPTVDALIRLLTAYLAALADRNGLYCGVGHHLSPADGSAITSSLVVSLQEFPEPVNPRILLKDLAATLADAGEHGQVDLVDLPGGPAMFVERERRLPAPSVPGLPAAPDGALTRVYQLEALVPSDDGRKLVAIEFATPFVSHGPEFRAMVVGMANSVSFEPPPPPSVSDALGG